MEMAGRTLVDADWNERMPGLARRDAEARCGDEDVDRFPCETGGDAAAPGDGRGLLQELPEEPRHLDAVSIAEGARKEAKARAVCGERDDAGAASGTAVTPCR